MLERVSKLLDRVDARVFDQDLFFRLERDAKDKDKGRVFLQVTYLARCVKEGAPKWWRGRKWYLSEYMTDDEIIKTAWAATQAAVTHELMENFCVDGVTLFNPHVNFEELLKISHKTVERTPPPPDYSPHDFE